MKIYYYEYTDDGVKWHKGAASFHSLKILQLAEEQPYKYKIYTVKFDPFHISKKWSKEKIARNLKKNMEVEGVMEVLKTFEVAK